MFTISESSVVVVKPPVVLSANGKHHNATDLVFVHSEGVVAVLAATALPGDDIFPNLLFNDTTAMIFSLLRRMTVLVRDRSEVIVAQHAQKLPPSGEEVFATFVLAIFFLIEYVGHS